MNLLSVHVDLLISEQEQYPVPKVHWIRLTEHYQISHHIGLTHGGAVYGFVFNETQPSQYRLPSDFEECFYIGKSGKSGKGGSYFDYKNGPNKNPKKVSFLNKRMIHHRDRFAGTATVCESEKKKYSLYEEKYGVGLDVMNGTYTDKPLWVGFIPAPIDIPDHLHEGWLLKCEQDEIYRYTKTFGYTPLMNLDQSGSNKKRNSFSTQYSPVELDQFMS